MRFSKAYLGTALAISAVVAGCAEERNVRNTVQPNIVRKTDLTGQWYYKPTVLDVPFGTSTTFIGEQAMDLEKIVWDIQEDVLYARRAFELVNNTDRAPGDAKYVGQPVGAWRIASQFDIIRDYNASTGEESNTIRETGERPWYEREFIRVDWSTNLSNNWGFMVDKVQLAPISYYVTDPNSPEALRFERRQVPGQTDANNTEVGYIDFTNKLFASPDTVYYEGYGYIPACWFSGSSDDCTAQELKLRHSFLKIDPTHEYEPQAWSDKDQERFGFFDVQRRTYNREYGQTESGRVKMARRFNLWIDPWQHDADGKVTLDENGVRVRKPERDRTARQLVYWANDTYPADLKDAGAEIVKGWSDVFHETVQFYADQSNGNMNILLADGTTVQFTDATPMILWCSDNPPTDSSPAGCRTAAGLRPNAATGQPKYNAVREGDLRFNMIVWVDKPQRGGPLGYGPMPADPETGETIHASSYIYGAGLDTYAAWARDIVLLLNGNISVGKFINGDNVKQFVGANFEGIRTASNARPADAGREAAGNMNFAWVPKMGDGTPKEIPHGAKAWREAMAASSNHLMDSGVLGPGFDRGELRMSSINGTYLESMLLADPEYRHAAAPVLAMHGLTPMTEIAAIPAEVRRQMSPNVLFGSTARRMNRDRAMLQAKHAVDMADFGEESALGLAKEYKSKFDLNTPAGQNSMWQELRTAIYRGVTEHEMGHNMGLRHNFEGSLDAMNFHKEYWDLRVAAAGGKDRVKGRYDANVTQAENDGKLNEYQYSTVMDYGAKFNSDIHGLGKYDHAALQYAYGNLVQVFNDQRNDATILDIDQFQTFGYPSALTDKVIGGQQRIVSINYTEFPNLVNLEDRTLVERSTIRNEVDGTLGHQEKEGMRRVTVPFRFCSDEFAGASVTCARFDQGADVFEIAQDYIRRYKSYYIFNNFKRDRWGWEGQGYVGRIIDRYMDPLSNQMKSLVRYRSSLEASLPVADVEFLFSDSAGWKGWSIAAQDGFDLLGEVMTSPEPGSYRATTTALGVPMMYQYSEDPGKGTFDMPLIDGRFFSTTWDFDSGYYWYERQTRLGFAIDKQIAAYMLSEASANYAGADTFSDIRKYSINYYTAYGEQLRNTFGGILNEDVSLLAPSFDAGKITPIRWSTLRGAVPTRTLGTAKLVDPAMTFTVKYYSALFGAALFRQSFDNSYGDQSKIFVDGNGEQVSFPLAQRKAWTDPLSGKTYVAWNGPANDGNAIGAKLLNHAQQLWTDNKPAEYKLFLEQIDLQRAISSVFDHTAF